MVFHQDLYGFLRIDPLLSDAVAASILEILLKGPIQGRGIALFDQEPGKMGSGDHCIRLPRFKPLQGDIHPVGLETADHLGVPLISDRLERIYLPAEGRVFQIHEQPQDVDLCPLPDTGKFDPRHQLHIASGSRLLCLPDPRHGVMVRQRDRLKSLPGRQLHHLSRGQRAVRGVRMDVQIDISHKRPPSFDRPYSHPYDHTIPQMLFQPVFPPAP